MFVVTMVINSEELVDSESHDIAKIKALTALVGRLSRVWAGKMVLNGDLRPFYLTFYFL